MVQAWYQGGLSVFDWTDIDHPQEIAFYDRGPVDATRMAMGGSWSAYWYNGVIVSSEIARGLDIYELVPSGLITENELAAAKTVKMAYWNTQDQQKLVWAPSFALARAYSISLRARTDWARTRSRQRARRWRRRSGARAHSAGPRSRAGHAAVWRRGFGSRLEEGRSAVSGCHAIWPTRNADGCASRLEFTSAAV